MKPVIYIPLSAVERLQRGKKVIRDKCAKCDKNMMAGYADPCWECPWRWILNEIVGNGK
jgi:hypothetical protein